MESSHPVPLAPNRRHCSSSMWQRVYPSRLSSTYRTIFEPCAMRRSGTRSWSKHAKWRKPWSGPWRSLFYPPMRELVYTGRRIQMGAIVEEHFSSASRLGSLNSPGRSSSLRLKLMVYFLGHNSHSPDFPGLCRTRSLCEIHRARNQLSYGGHDQSSEHEHRASCPRDGS